MNKKTLLGTLLASTLVFSNIGFAQESSDDEQTQSPQYERDYNDGEYEGKRKGKYKGKGKRKAKRLAKMMERVDTNEDGQIDLNEFLTHSEQRFQKMDLNSNGYVTPEEARESHKQMREEMREKFKQFKENRDES